MFEVCNFRQMKHAEDELNAQFVTEQKVQRSNVVDIDCEIKNQIVFNFHLDLIQRKS